MKQLLSIILFILILFYLSEDDKLNVTLSNKSFQLFLIFLIIIISYNNLNYLILFILVILPLLFKSNLKDSVIKKYRSINIYKDFNIIVEKMKDKIADGFNYKEKYTNNTLDEEINNTTLYSTPDLIDKGNQMDNSVPTDNTNYDENNDDENNDYENNDDDDDENKDIDLDEFNNYKKEVTLNNKYQYDLLKKKYNNLIDKIDKIDKNK